MIEQLSITTKRIKGSVISEAKVLDTETNKYYYVVTSLGSLFYKTFESSYIDYVKGKTKEEPVMVEGDDYYWINIPQDGKITRFIKQYELTDKEASKLAHKYYISAKYSHLKKPLNNFKYEIVNKDSKGTFACGPTGEIYEIEVLLLDTNEHLFVQYDGMWDIYSISKDSIIALYENTEDGEEMDILDYIEEFEGFSEAKKSEYYDLYLELEKVKDGYYD